jgi:S1-C subfamily serine protease
MILTNPLITAVLTLASFTWLAPETKVIPDDGTPIQAGVGLERGLPDYFCLVKVSETPLPSIGSGAFLRPNLVLTAAHNVTDVLNGKGKLLVHTKNGDVYRDIKVIRYDRVKDLALLLVGDEDLDQERWCIDVSLGDKAPDSVASIGYEPATRSVILAIGQRTGTVYAPKGSSNGHWIGVTNKTVQGMSGCPVINYYGELVGVVVAVNTRNGEGYIVALKHIQEFLSQYRPD